MQTNESMLSKYKGDILHNPILVLLRRIRIKKIFQCQNFYKTFFPKINFGHDSKYEHMIKFVQKQ